MAIPTVNPFEIPALMTREQLEYWILFGVCVANKSAKQTEIKVKALLEDLGTIYMTPFEKVAIAIKQRRLMALLIKHKLGQYKRINRAFREAIKLDLGNLSVHQLESVHGIGPKTARMICLYYFPNAQVVPLDTHVLKFLRAKGYDAPKNTPSAGKKYNKLEQAFVNEAIKAGKTVRELDTEVWLSYAKQ